jgi:hypothetical protein
MKFANANNLHRKSGKAHHSFGDMDRQVHGRSSKSIRNISFSAHVRSHGKPGRVGERGAPVLPPAGLSSF